MTVTKNSRKASESTVNKEEVFPLRGPDQEPDESSGVGLKKELGLFDSVGVIIGIIIGSGIFIAPTGVVKYAGSVGMSLVIWLLAGCLAIIGALCYAELGTMIPKSGGDYTYVLEIFGNLPAFLYMWVVMTIILPTRNAIVAMTFANYIILPAFPDCDSPPIEAVKIVAALVICLLTWINCTNVKAATKIQDIFTVAKVFSLVVIIGTGAYYLGTGHTSNYTHPFEETNWSASSIAMAFYQGLFSYAGWNYINFIVEELRDPYKNLPRSILISLPTVIVVYVLTNVAYFAVLTPSEMVASSAVAVTFGNKMLGFMAWIIPLFVACSTFGGLNGGIFAVSRLIFVAARQGHLPQALELINTDAMSPTPSLILLSSLTLFMLTFSDITALINYVSFSESIFMLASVTGLLWMRYKHPELPRPVKVSVILPIVFFIIRLLIVILPLIENPVELVTAIGIIATGVPVYFCFIYWKEKPKNFNYITDKLTCGIQILTNGLPQDKSD